MVKCCVAAGCYSVLCSEHFADQYFEPQSKIATSFDTIKVPTLKPDVVPTIFSRPLQAASIYLLGVKVRKKAISYKIIFNPSEFG